MPSFRVGLGTDFHRLEEGIPLVLGGVIIPWHKGPAGHSDGDVVVHALCDALLGSGALRDIGYHFSDTDPKYKGISSIILLQKCVELIQGSNLRIVNVDVVIHLQAPKLMPYITQMTDVLSKALGIDANCVSIKAKTGEGVGQVGEGKGVEAIAVCLVKTIS